MCRPILLHVWQIFLAMHIFRKLKLQFRKLQYIPLSLVNTCGDIHVWGEQNHTQTIWSATIVHVGALKNIERTTTNKTYNVWKYQLSLNLVCIWVILPCFQKYSSRGMRVRSKGKEKWKTDSLGPAQIDGSSG